MHITNVVQPH